MIELPQMVLKIRRLQKLMGGLCAECQLWRDGDEPFLPEECGEYLDAIQDGIAGADRALTVLDKVVKRLVAKEAVPLGGRPA
jgi:hypothetical protein